MSTTYYTGDLFCVDDPEALAHGCNCIGAMGAGIAVEFKERWPVMYEKYQVLCRQGLFVPGQVMVWTHPDQTTIFNLGTQEALDGATPLFLRGSLERMVELAEEFDITDVWMPLIGAGLGGLDYRLVLNTMNETATPEVHFHIVLEYVEGMVPEFKPEDEVYG